MRLYPAIDIKDGKCVRLKKGLFNEVTVYSDKPYEIAESFEADGAKFIHTVDLDGARGGHSVNSETIKKIVDSVSVPVQLGGGIRTLEDIETVLNLGIYRAIIGTKAIASSLYAHEKSFFYEKSLKVSSFGLSNGISNWYIMIYKNDTFLISLQEVS